MILTAKWLYFVNFDFLPLSLLLARSHQGDQAEINAEIIIVKRLIQRRNNVFNESVHYCPVSFDMIAILGITKQSVYLIAEDCK